MVVEADGTLDKYQITDSGLQEGMFIKREKMHKLKHAAKR
jgi:hypothetical protein